MKWKKAFLSTTLAALMTTTPIVVAVSCNSNSTYKWKTNLEVGQEYALEQGSTLSTLEFALPKDLAENAMRLQIWLAGYGFTLFSNSTSMFDYLLTNIPDVKRFHELNEKNTLNPKEKLEHKKLEERVKEWCKTKVDNLTNEVKNKIQDISWTSKGKDVLESFPRKYKITKIEKTSRGIGINTTLSTKLPQGQINGYIVKDSDSGKVLSKNSITVEGIKNKIKDIKNTIKKAGNPSHLLNPAFYSKNAIVKRFIGIKFSEELVNITSVSNKSVTLPVALEELKTKTSPKELEDYVEIFNSIEAAIDKFIMDKIRTENGNITKLFTKGSYTYTPTEIIKDLQNKVKNDPKYKNLLGNVEPNNLSWLK